MHTILTAFVKLLRAYLQQSSGWRRRKVRTLGCGTATSLLEGIPSQE